MSTEKNIQPKTDFKDSLTVYFRGVKSEWSKVSWPTRQQVIFETCVVIAVVTFFTIAVYIIDKLYEFGLAQISNHFIK